MVFSWFGTGFFLWKSGGFLCPISEVHVANKFPISVASQGTVWPKQWIAGIAVVWNKWSQLTPWLPWQNQGVLSGNGNGCFFGMIIGDSNFIHIFSPEKRHSLLWNSYIYINKRVFFKIAFWPLLLVVQWYRFFFWSMNRRFDDERCSTSPGRPEKAAGGMVAQNHWAFNSSTYQS